MKKLSWVFLLIGLSLFSVAAKRDLIAIEEPCPDEKDIMSETLKCRPDMATVLCSNWNNAGNIACEVVGQEVTYNNKLITRKKDDSTKGWKALGGGKDWPCFTYFKCIYYPSGSCVADVDLDGFDDLSQALPNNEPCNTKKATED